MRTTQSPTAGTALERRILVVGDADWSAVVVATNPAELEESFGEQLEATLRSVRFDPTRPVGAFEGLGFTIEETAALAVSARTSHTLSLVATGADGPDAPLAPSLVIASSFTLTPVRDVEAFARERLARTRDLRRVEIVSSESRALDGLQAWEIVARCDHDGSGSPVAVFQTIAIDGRRYFVIHGVVGADAADDWIPRFRTVTSSFRRM